MPDPISTGALILGSGLTALKTVRDIQTSRAEGKAAREFTKFNAEVEEQQGEEAFRRKVEEARILQDRVKRVQAKNVAKGAPLLIQQENATAAKIEQFKLIREGRIAKQKSETRADIINKSGRSAKRAANTRVASSLLQGGAQLAGNAFSILNR